MPMTARTAVRGDLTLSRRGPARPRAGAGLGQRKLRSSRPNVGRLIAIGTFGTRDEAEIVQGLLASAGIDASIRADDAGGAYPFVLSGGAQVLVDESDATAASEIVSNRTDET